jgi:hypothetical protein
MSSFPSPPPFAPTSHSSPTPSLPSRKCFALISDFDEERVKALIKRTRGFLIGEVRIAI